MAVVKGVRYIPGTRIPYMGTKLYGKAVAEAGKNARLEGLTGALSNLGASLTRGIASATIDTGKAFAEVEMATLAGLLRAASFVSEDMNKTPPLIPVDTGALRQGYTIIPVVKEFKRKGKASDKRIAVEAGWPDVQIKREGEMVDQYAAYVHEMTSPPYGKVKWNRHLSGPKFLESAVKRNSAKIVEIVQGEIRKVTR